MRTMMTPVTRDEFLAALSRYPDREHNCVTICEPPQHFYWTSPDKAAAFGEGAFAKYIVDDWQSPPQTSYFLDPEQM